MAVFKFLRWQPPNPYALVFDGLPGPGYKAAPPYFHQNDSEGCRIHHIIYAPQQRISPLNVPPHQKKKKKKKNLVPPLFSIQLLSNHYQSCARGLPC